MHGGLHIIAVPAVFTVFQVLLFFSLSLFPPLVLVLQLGISHEQGQSI